MMDSQYPQRVIRRLHWARDKANRIREKGRGACAVTASDSALLPLWSIIARGREINDYILHGS
jgi:hypothetical protein